VDAARFRKAFAILKRLYPVRNWALGRGSFDVLVSIILSQNSTDLVTERVMGDLRSRGPITPESLLAKSQSQLVGILRPAGLARQKVPRIRAVARRVIRDYGGDLNRLRAMDTVTAREALMALPGVGPKTTEELATLGIRTIGELARSPADLLVERFGRNGTYMWRIANGLDIGHVHSEEGARSIGAENTFPEDVEDRQTILNSLQAQAEEVAARLEVEKYLFRTAELKIRFADFDTHIRRKSLPTHTASKEDLLKTAEHLLSEMLLPGRKVRLIGVRASNLKKRAPVETLLSWTA